MNAADSDPAFGVHLRRTDENADEVAALGAAAAGTGLDQLLGDLNRRARRTLAPAWPPRRAYSFDRADSGRCGWMPQGISTSADAGDERRIVAVSWYSKRNEGVRITFLDLDTRRYRHVLVVDPVVREGQRDSQVVAEPLHVHAGGIVWAGPYLYIAATGRGLYICRLDDIVQLREPMPHTGDYRYLLPVRFAYRAETDEGRTGLRYSFLSLDRTGSTPHLVAGEYGRGGQTTRLVRFQLDPETFQLVTGVDGVSRPAALAEGGPDQMQGACVVNGTWYLTASRSPYLPGTLYVGRPGHWTARRGALPIGPEDIAYWPETDTLWSVSEHPWRRWVYAFKRPVR